MLSLKEDSACDNVLLEWALTVELQSLGKLSSCFPILMGTYTPSAADEPDGSKSTPMSSLFASDTVAQLASSTLNPGSLTLNP